MCIFGNSEDTLKVISQSLDFFEILFVQSKIYLVISRV